MLAALAVSMWINFFDAVWHGFNNPEGFYWRYAFFLSIIIIIGGYKGFTAFSAEGGDGSKKYRPVLITSVILYLYMLWLILSKNPYMDRERIVINAVIIALVALGSVLCKKGSKTAIIGCLIITLVSASDMIYSSRESYLCLNSHEGELPLMSDFKDDYRDIGSAVDYVKESDSGLYRIEKDFDRAVNDPALFDYIGLSHDSSCEKDEVLDWLLNFGFCKTVYYTYYNGGSTSFVDDLFGIKYYISRFDEVHKPYEHMPYEGKYHVYKNTGALPMAYIAPKGLTDLEPGEENTFEKQNLIGSFWEGTDEIYHKAEYSVSLENVKELSEGQYVKEEDDAYVIYTVSIEEEQPLYLYFSAPQRQGGELFINGGSADLYFTENHWNVLCAGQYKKGDTVQIRIKLLNDELTVSEACFYYEDKEALKNWSLKAEEYNREISDVNEISSSHLKFDLNAAEDRDVILSIPHDDCWRVYCDGTKIPTRRAMGMLMGMEIPAGNHTIEMKYVPRGTLPGAVASFIGLVLFAVGLISLKRK